MRIGITGHQRLAQASEWDWARVETRRIVDRYDRPLIGISCLAAGADQLFAEIVLEKEGMLEAVIPFPEYEHSFSNPQDREKYRALLSSASSVEVLEKTRSTEEAYLAAGKRVVDLAEVMLAIWNGEPAGGVGGTADIVQYSRQTKTTLIHLNPITQEVIQIG